MTSDEKIEVTYFGDYIDKGDKKYIIYREYEEGNPQNYSLCIIKIEGDDFLTLYVHSSGADNDRIVEVRRKPSTGQWFLWEQMLLAQIREPNDPWA